MMKLQITTFVLVGGLVGLFTDGVMIGVGAAALVFIAYRMEKFLDRKSDAPMQTESVEEVQAQKPQVQLKKEGYDDKSI
ncbi:DUF3329 domain-containing protein [Ureibacillus sinduriensis]|uniref:Uncharacterized protein n=1 Tax=Ureibacillus sinduriensis BLB-1 = JCM 15800 TaxID=1384057 RepID=A0A0A3HU94_9BACL|nr:DUF3329 domain-containing protein [Ureibacillus sinduriensis]KGR76171.1 hypothetical protein CD33_08385 [Ureibacillus sinduriensis BLB-1 = JCM 15800]